MASTDPIIEAGYRGDPPETECCGANPAGPCKPWCDNYHPADGDPIKFELSDTPVWRGFAHGSTWNGWDNVYVTPMVHADIVAYLTAQAGPDASPEAIADSVSGIDVIEPFARDGETYYSLGWGYVAHIIRPDDSRYWTDDRDGGAELSQDECDAIGADGRDGRGIITYHNLTEREAVTLAFFQQREVR